MAVGYVLGGGFTSTADVGTTGPIQVGQAIGVGEGAAVWVAGGNASATAAISDSKGNTWVAGTRVANTNTPAGFGQWFLLPPITDPAKALAATDTFTVTRSPNGGLTTQLHKVTGWDGNYTQTPANTGNSTTPNNAALGVTAAGGILWGIQTPNNAGLTITAANNLVELSQRTSSGGSNPRRGWTFALADAIAGSIAPSGTMSTSLGWGAIAVALGAVPAPAEPPGTHVARRSTGGVVTTYRVVSRTGATTTEHAIVLGPSPPAATTGDALMGIYRGNFPENPDETHMARTGYYPDFTSQYVQAAGVSGGDFNVAATNERMGKGIIPLTTTSMSRKANDGGPTPVTHADMAAGTPAAMAWIEGRQAQIASLGHPTIEVWDTIDHEFEVKENHGQYLWSPTTADYIGAFNRWQAAMRAARPNLKSVYWYGYSRTSWIGPIINGIDPPDIIALDPYVFAHHSPTTTLEQMAEPKLDWLRSQPGYQGQPIIFAEYAKDSSRGEQEMADFLTNLRPRFDALGVMGACYFSRNKADSDANLGIKGDILASGNPHPAALAAYTASLAAKSTVN